MIIQTNPEAFSRAYPIYTVTDINRATGVVTLTGSDDSTKQERLDSWGPFEDGHAVVGSQVQYLPDK